MPKEDIIYDIWLSQIKGVGNVVIKRLLRHFKSAEAVYKNKSASEYNMIEGIPLNLAEVIGKNRELDEAKAVYEQLEKEEIGVIRSTDRIYPKALSETYANPHLIFYKGKNLFLRQGAAIAVVGTRKATPYGITAAKVITERLAKSGITIVSGLALGIDACAHRAALDAGGETIAVLGCGVEHIYPPANRELYERIIAENGMILSEFLPNVAPIPANFPVRNRIISALAMGTLVVEAAEHSGSLITAAYALEQNREVYAVPSDITSAVGKGTNRLIKEGAHLVTCADDILGDLYHVLSPYSGKGGECEKKEELTGEEQKVFDSVLAGAKTCDEIAVKLLKNISYINSVLTMLEIKQYITVKMGTIFLLA